MKQRTISPVDGSLYVERELASGGALEDCLDRAAAPQRSGRRIPVAERAALCRRMAEWCVARAEELGKELSWQMGRPVGQSPGELRRGFHERAHYMCGIAEEALSDIRIPKKEGFERFIRGET